MTTDLEALVVAAYVFADEYPVPARCGRRPLVSDAELVALSVAQAAVRISSDRSTTASTSCRAVSPPMRKPANAGLLHVPLDKPHSISAVGPIDVLHLGEGAEWRFAAE